jgi:flagellar assembly protein FliH
MSSFRIDRQYVAFETAETQPVHATVKAQKEKLGPDDMSAYSGDVSKLYDEIYERLLSEHAEQAECMLSKASSEAQDIIEKAKKHAEEIIQQARCDTEKMRSELLTQMQEASTERKSQAETELIELETKLRNDYTKQVDELRGNVIGLVMEIVKKIIGIKLSQTDEIFVGMISDAIEQLKQTGSVVIRLSPEDYARYFGTARGESGDSLLRETLDAGETKIAVIEEPDFKTGDLIVESEGEMIDLSIDRQLGLIEKAFLN